MTNLWPLGIMFAGLLLLSLGGCAFGGSINPNQISGTAAGLFGIPAATVSTQLGAEIDEMAIFAQKLQMLKAVLNGTPLPPLP